MSPTLSEFALNGCAVVCVAFVALLLSLGNGLLSCHQGCLLALQLLSLGCQCLGCLLELGQEVARGGGEAVGALEERLELLQVLAVSVLCEANLLGGLPCLLDSSIDLRARDGFTCRSCRQAQ